MIQEFKSGSFLSLKENSSVYMGHVFYFKVKIFVRLLLGGEINFPLILTLNFLDVFPLLLDE